MKRIQSYRPGNGFRVIVLIGFFLSYFSTAAFSQGDILNLAETRCNDCFSTEIYESEITDECITTTLVVKMKDRCYADLSHFMVAIPCGNITEVSNSGGWKIETDIKDPTTGLSGFKIDDIDGFGGCSKIDSFTVTFTVCSSDPGCLDEIYGHLKVAYKAGTCVFYEDVDNDSGDDDGDDGGNNGGNGLDLVLSPVNITCFNGNNGAVYSEITGGTPPFTYLWSNGSTESEITMLLAGTYYLEVTDSLGFVVSDSAIVTQPETGINISGEITHASCNKEDGGISTSVTGGVPPYIYSWSNGDSAANLADLGAGLYLLTVTDASGCSFNRGFKVEENSDLSVLLSPNYLECYQEGQGEILATVSGGTAPFNYLWSTGATTQNVSGLNTGAYTLTVTDADGCSYKQATYIGIKTLSLSSSVVSPTCNGGDDGEISITGVRNGTEPYTYVWDTGDTTETITGIPSGRYTVIVTDSFGCTLTKSINLADKKQLSLSFSVSPRDCNPDADAEVFLEGSGGEGPYEIYLGDSMVTSPVILPGNGDYVFTMMDALGCETTKTLTISSSDNLNLTTNISQPSCNGPETGSVVVIASGGTSPYRYEWFDGMIKASRDNLAPGTYDLQVVDANGCFKDASITIQEINDVSVEITGPADSIFCGTADNLVYAVTGGATGFEWELITQDTGWVMTASAMDQMVFDAGTGTALGVITVMNDEGCTASDTVSLGCYESDGGDGGDGSDGGDDGSGSDGDDDGNGGSDDCLVHCWNTTISKIESIGNNCYKFEMWVKTDGYCTHDLSHLVVGLDYGYVSKLYNSGGWNYELNSTDPKSGVYGFKIDDISGFGGKKKEFRNWFEVCFDHPGDDEYLPEQIPVVYKAGNCSYTQVLDVYEPGEGSDIDVCAYPNPFSEKIAISVCSPEDVDVDICIFNVNGHKVEQLYKGKLIKDVRYSFPFRGNYSTDNLFFYTIISRDKVIKGQILKIR